MSKDIDERFDAKFGWLFKGLDEERVTNDADRISTDIKSFLRKELADQKAALMKEYDIPKRTHTSK